MVLEASTKIYWNVSKVVRGRMNAAITTERALQLLNLVLDETVRDSSLHRYTQALKETIITGR